MKMEARNGWRHKAKRWGTREKEYKEKEGNCLQVISRLLIKSIGSNRPQNRSKKKEREREREREREIKLSQKSQHENEDGKRRKRKYIPEPAAAADPASSVLSN